MVELKRTNTTPYSYIWVSVTQMHSPVIRKRCTKHGVTGFVLAQHNAQVCAKDGDRLSELEIVVYSCATCLSELSGRSKAHIIREAHTRELKLAFGNKCINCGYSEHPEILEFHHVFPANKNSSIGTKKTFVQKFAEAQKCLLLCPNCHSLADKGKLLNIPELFKKQYTIVKTAVGEDVDLNIMKSVLTKLDEITEDLS